MGTPRGALQLVVRDEVVPSSAGDLVLLPRADPHQLRSHGRHVDAVDSFRLAEAEGIVRNAEGGERVVILCGAFIFHRTDRYLLAALPHVIRVPGKAGQAQAWLAPYVEVLSAETAATDGGSDMIMARLSDALIARTLRAEAGTSGQGGWLGALRDPRLARALALMHGQFAAGWSLPELARQAGFSRAAFAAQFARALGLPPMQYLTGVRMRKAALLLADGASVAQAAQAVGYGSEAAFSAAFHRYAGTAPGAYRRATRGG